MRMCSPDRHRRTHIGTFDSRRQPTTPAYVGLSGVYCRHCRVRMDMLEPAKRGDMDTYCRGHPRNGRNKRCRHITANNLIHNNVDTYQQSI